MPDSKSKHARSLNKLDEYYLLPILLGLALVSSICLLFFLNELTKSQFEVEEYYGWDKVQYSAYRTRLLIYITATALLLVLQSYSLRLKKRWLYLLLIGLNVLLFIYLPSVVQFQPAM
ncbi:MAG: hypothetical protein AAF717_07625 [Bacteroidota bacterium]